jgi:hypothetical protein
VSLRAYARLVVVAPAVLIAPILVCLPGCSSGTPTGEVAGKVTFEGKSVAEGRITFVQTQSGASDDALLNSDGSYAIKTPLPVGDYKVMVTPLIVRQQVGGKGPVVGEEKPAPDIPEKYRTIGSTALTATVKEGKNECNFDMKKR